jgi:hypothetical protein
MRDFVILFIQLIVTVAQLGLPGRALIRSVLRRLGARLRLRLRMHAQEQFLVTATAPVPDSTKVAYSTPHSQQQERRRPLAKKWREICQKLFEKSSGKPLGIPSFMFHERLCPGISAMQRKIRLCRLTVSAVRASAREC